MVDVASHPGVRGLADRGGTTAVVVQFLDVFNVELLILFPFRSKLLFSTWNGTECLVIVRKRVIRFCVKN